MIPRIGITLGDPGGIGPEVFIKALHKPLPRAQYIVYGSKKVLQYHSNQLRSALDWGKFQLVNIPNVERPYFGSNPELSGKASVEYLEAAFDAYHSNRIDAIVTGPIHKESWHQAGFSYPGQTEYCAEKTGSKDSCMLMAGQHFRVALLSTHYSLKKALKQVTRSRIVRKLRLIYSEFQKLGFPQPRIVCAALNPHAGEAGAFGSEEEQIIIPALCQLKSEGIEIEGPVAPEVVFRVAVAEKKWDVIFSLFHDQAMIPFKLIDFDRSANVTLGLPLIRTSPDHGTAFDIAGKGIANPGSMVFAIRLAAEWTRLRLKYAHSGTGHRQT